MLSCCLNVDHIHDQCKIKHNLSIEIDVLPYFSSFTVELLDWYNMMFKGKATSVDLGRLYAALLRNLHVQII